jgi:hypothetical protein
MEKGNWKDAFKMLAFFRCSDSYNQFIFTAEYQNSAFAYLHSRYNKKVNTTIV